MTYTKNMFYFLGGILLWYILIFMYKTKTGSPSVMSKSRHIKRLVKYVEPGMNVSDMGCGDGEVLISMIEEGAARGEGWEIEPYVWLVARVKIMRAGLADKVRINFGDMWRADLSQSDLVYVYQLTRYAGRFVKKCKSEMKEGTLVIANTYPLKGLREVKRDGKLYIYQI